MTEAKKFVENIQEVRKKQGCPMTAFEINAAEFAFEAHRGQKRKFSYEDYILHPAEVSSIISQITKNQEVLAAAWLHDVVEDCSIKLPEIFDCFGYDVTLYVSELTNPSQINPMLSRSPRAVRKEADKAHLQTSSAETQTVKLADIMSNLPSLVYNDPKFAKIWVKEKYDLVFVMDRGNEKLRKATFAQIQMANDLLNSD